MSREQKEQIRRLQEDVEWEHQRRKEASQELRDVEHKLASVEDDFAWLVKTAFPDISLTREWTYADTKEQVSKFIGWQSALGFSPPETKAKSVAELRKDIEDKLERDYFKSLSQAEKIHYLFEQRQQRND